MGKKKWIDKKKSVTYVVTNRSMSDDQALSKNVLVPIMVYGKPVKNQTHPSAKHFGEEIGKNVEISDNNSVSQFEDAEERDYNYDKHLKSIGEADGVFVSVSGKITKLNPQNLPLEVLPPDLAEHEELDERFVDPEVTQALEEFDSAVYEELPDDFIKMAQSDDVEDFEFGDYGSLDEIEGDDTMNVKKVDKVKTKNEKDDEEYQFGDYGDLDDIEEDDMALNKEKITVSKPKLISTEKFAINTKPPAPYQPPPGRKRTVIDEMFDAAFDNFVKGKYDDVDEDNFKDDDDLSDEENENHDDDDDVEENPLLDLLALQADDKLKDQKKLKFGLPELEDIDRDTFLIRAGILFSDTASVDTNIEGAEIDEQLSTLFIKEKHSQWDAESILSSYTNTDNHPKIIAEPKLEKKIALNKKGYPDVFKKDTIEEEEEDEETNKGLSRKNENPEQKKERQKAMKEERKANRQKKKELKVKFRSEEVKQRKQNVGNIAKRTVIIY